MQTKNFQESKLGLEKEEELEIKLPTFAGSEKVREFKKNIYLCFINYTTAFDSVDHNKLWKALKETGIPDHLTCLLKNLLRVKKQYSECCVEHLIGSRLKNEYDRVVFCHPIKSIC